MTRKKKSRSLKRIHSVKTGNISKLKRSGTSDRQNTNLKTKTKPKSVYQKFLDENPDAVEKQTQSAAPAKPVKNIKPDPKQANVKKKKEKVNESDQEQKLDKEPDLLSQLDNKNFNDLY